MLDVRKLRMLAELDRLGTISAVAEELHLSAPGVSMQLAALGREVGLPLTERQGRRVVLTPAGRLLAQHGHDISDLLTVAEMEVATLREGSSGTYRIAAFPTAARSFVADAWQRLLEAPEPALTVELVELEPHEALPALASGDVQLAVTHAYSNRPAIRSPGLLTTRIATEQVRIAVHAADPAAVAARRGSAAVSLSAFENHRWILPNAQLSCAEMVQRACGAAGFAPHSAAEATDFSVQLALVAAGVGVALIPELASASVPADVRLLSLAQPVLRHDFVAIRRSSQADPGVRRLRALLAECAAQVVADPGPVRAR